MVTMVTWVQTHHCLINGIGCLVRKYARGETRDALLHLAGGSTGSHDIASLPNTRGVVAVGLS